MFQFPPTVIDGFNPDVDPLADVAPDAPVYDGLPPPPGLLACTACPARSEALQVVPGVGPADAPIYVLGQNPGHEEDVAGQPFIGPSGEEFDRWLAVLGIDRARIFISNVVKCHTQGNRVPRSSEITACSNLWVPAELSALPSVRVLMPLGKPAIVRLLGKSAPPLQPLMIHHIRVRVLDREMSVFPLPHPAFLLRAAHFGPVFRETLLPQVRETLQHELKVVYDACRRHQ